ncbi:MAG: sel1 repeat family protein [Phycisphaerae bacterium]|nr:sel1 repeat family protein [Phycisphaerae bacterium]
MKLDSKSSCAKENLDSSISQIQGSKNMSGVDDSFRELLEKAKQGDAQAQYELGKKYDPSECDSIDNDEEMAKWYRMAAEQGHAEAQLKLGTAFMNGTGVTFDWEKAAYWLHKAAEQNISDAQMVLGFMYMEGAGVPKDYKEAYKWNSKAAERGNPVAQESLSRMYAHGKGVIEDYVQAYKWLLLAGMQGENVSEGEEWLRERMTSEQITKAQELAKEFIATGGQGE